MSKRLFQTIIISICTLILVPFSASTYFNFKYLAADLRGMPISTTCLMDIYSILSYSWQNHNLAPKYDFHSYMIRSMEEEFQRIVGVR